MLPPILFRCGRDHEELTLPALLVVFFSASEELTADERSEESAWRKLKKKSYGKNEILVDACFLWEDGFGLISSFTLINTYVQRKEPFTGSVVMDLAFINLYDGESRWQR